MQVESLKLGWCKLGPGEGAQAVANLLQFNTTIRTLDLRGNNLGNDGERRWWVGEMGSAAGLWRVLVATREGRPCTLSKPHHCHPFLAPQPILPPTPSPLLSSPPPPLKLQAPSWYLGH